MRSWWITCCAAVIAATVSVASPSSAGTASVSSAETALAPAQTISIGMSRLHGTFNSSGTVTMSVASGAGSAKVSLTSPTGASVQLVVLDEAGGVLFTKAGMAFLAATVPVPSGTHRVVASGPRERACC